jgi:uncharacterized protein YyaL (SSP411 family)
MSFKNPNWVFAVSLFVLMSGITSCRKKNGQADSQLLIPMGVVPELRANALRDLPGVIYQGQADSPIHWQPWTSQTLERASAANRLIFALIAMPQQKGYVNILSKLASDASLVSSIHEYYVPVLIDGDASREIGLLCADLCAEMKRGLQFPIFAWITPGGDPVAWITVPDAKETNVSALFQQSHSMIHRTWIEDYPYVVKNSAMDNSSRRRRISERKMTKVVSQEPGADAVRGIRQLTTLYDPELKSFDEAGGLFPAGSIDLLATAVYHPGLPPDLRARCLKTSRDLLEDLLRSPMFDLLEDGVFSSRNASSWSLPAFSRDCVSQARITVALLHGYRATGNPMALEKALGLIRFAEQSFRTPEELFALGFIDENPAIHWLWTVEQIKQALAPQDADWWITATGMQELGNLAPETDVRRQFLRYNSLGLVQSPAEIAADLSMTPEAFAARFEKVRQTLLDVRKARLKPVPRDLSSHAGSTFRMVSAYAAAFGVTGEETYRQKAVTLLGKARVSFSEGNRLNQFTRKAPSSIGAARAFTYGLALQAALDVSDITSDESWLVWAEDLATVAAELFTSDDHLKECPDDAAMMDLPITDLVMLFDDSTAGLISMAECRLHERERPMVESFSALATPLPVYAAVRPILHTDLLQATMARHFKVIVVIGSGLSAEMKLAIERLPMRTIQRRAAKSSDEVPPGSAMICLENGERQLVATPQALNLAVLPSPIE